jgi:hypothetical protein
MAYQDFYNKFQHLLTSSIGTIWDPHEFCADEKIDFDYVHHSHLISFTENEDGIYEQSPNPPFDVLETILSCIHPNRLKCDIIYKELVIFMAIQTQKTVEVINSTPVTYYHRFIPLIQIYNILFNNDTY